mgnify:CR=1 FL=1
MEKIVFVDWDRYKTEVRVIRLNGDGFIQDARFDRKQTFTGECDRQVYEIAQFIARVQPDRVVADSMAFGAVLSERLRKMISDMGLDKKRTKEIEERIEYRPRNGVNF